MPDPKNRSAGARRRPALAGPRHRAAGGVAAPCRGRFHRPGQLRPAPRRSRPPAARGGHCRGGVVPPPGPATHDRPAPRCGSRSPGKSFERTGLGSPPRFRLHHDCRPRSAFPLASGRPQLPSSRSVFPLASGRPQSASSLLARRKLLARRSRRERALRLAGIGSLRGRPGCRTRRRTASRSASCRSCRRTSGRPAPPLARARSPGRICRRRSPGRSSGTARWPGRGS